ncbi:MAG: hypothetical protein ACRDLA_19765, partial [Thermoleophilaceae bacterium]
FLGFVLLLVGARLRVIALRRRRRAPAQEDDADPREELHEAVHAHRLDLDRDRLDLEPDEWHFPDPHEPAPTGLLPSTAGARRRVLRAESVTIGQGADRREVHA